jgi:hypothetical protein
MTYPPLARLADPSLKGGDIKMSTLQLVQLRYGRDCPFLQERVTSLSEPE